jgi:hypothetical protein
MSNQKNNKKQIIIALIFLTALLFVFYGIQRLGKPSPFGFEGKDYTAFAKCLATKNVKMYGAYNCVHCLGQKKAFGDAFKYVPYVECTKDIKKCIDDGVQ